MGRVSKKKKACQRNGAAGNEVIESRHEVIKRDLRDSLSSTVSQLETMRKESDALKEKNKNLSEIIDSMRKDKKEMEKEIESLKKEVTRVQEQLYRTQKSTDFINDQVSELRQKNMRLDLINRELRQNSENFEKELIFYKKNQNALVKDAIIREKMNVQREHWKQMDEKDSRIAQLVIEPPTGGSKLRSYRLENSRATKDNRCAKMIESIEKSVGSSNLDNFLSDLCSFIAKSPKYSFRTSLTDMESFFAASKWKMSSKRVFSWIFVSWVIPIRRP